MTLLYWESSPTRIHHINPALNKKSRNFVNTASFMEKRENGTISPHIIRSNKLTDRRRGNFKMMRSRFRNPRTPPTNSNVRLRPRGHKSFFIWGFQLPAQNYTYTYPHGEGRAESQANNKNAPPSKPSSSNLSCV
jgi:hypothetical protein